MKRSGSAAVYFAAAAGTLACSPADDEVPPKLVALSEDCTMAKLTFKAKAGTQLGIGKSKGVAGPDGLVRLDVPRAHLVFDTASRFETSAPYTLDVRFGPALSQSFTARMSLSSRLLVRVRTKSWDGKFLTMALRDSCGNSETLDGSGQMPADDDGSPKVTLVAWGAEAVRATYGTAEIEPRRHATELLRSVTFRPDFEPVLRSSDLSAPISLTMKLENSMPQRLEITMTLDPNTYSQWEVGRMLGATLRKYHDVRTHPVSSAPPFVAGATIHPTLLFEHGQTRAGRRDPYLRGVFLGDRTVDAVQAVAFYSRKSQPSVACRSPTANAHGSGDAFRVFETQVEILEAKTGRFLDGKTFNKAPADCAHGATVAREEGSGSTEQKAFSWLADWTGSPMKRLGSPTVVP